MVVTNVLQTLAVMGLRTLRENIILASLANRSYEQQITGASKGATVNVVVASAVAAVNVAPAAVPPTTADQTPTVVPITLTDWQEAPFFLTDFALAQVQQGIIPMQAQEAVKALVNAIELSIWTNATFYGFAGTPGVTPFATDLSAFLSARTIANKQLMPMDPRYAVINPDAEGNALGLRAFQDASFRGDQDGIVNGQIGRKLGAVWAMSQLVPTQSPGTAASYVTNGVQAIGTKALNIKTGTGTILKGAILTIAGDTQTYAVQADAVAGGTQTITIEPGLKIATTDGLAITFKAAFVKNILFHRDAIGFAMAPLLDTNVSDKLVDMAVAVDEVSGLALRIELTREHKRWRWSYDAMWGSKLVRPEFGVIFAG